MQDTRDRPLASLDFPLGLIEEFRASYALDVIWTAPRRGVRWCGRENVVTQLLREAAAMQALAFTRLRRSTGEAQIIDEFVARFTYGGEGIENVHLPAGADIELERVRILTLSDNHVTQETAIETWTVLGARAPGLSP